MAIKTTGSDTICLLLNLFQYSRRLFVRVVTGKPAAAEASKKRKSPSQLRRDKERLELFQGKKDNRDTDENVVEDLEANSLTGDFNESSTSGDNLGSVVNVIDERQGSGVQDSSSISSLSRSSPSTPPTCHLMSR